MFFRIFHDLPDILTSIFDNEIVSSRVIRKERGNVVDLAVASDPTAFERVLFCNIFRGEDTDTFGDRHGGTKQVWFPALFVSNDGIPTTLTTFWITWI